MESYKVVKTDTLKVQIFDMAVIDLSRRFCYCFIEPIPMIWQNDGRIPLAFQGRYRDDYEKGTDPLAGFLLSKYKETIENTKRQGIWDVSLDWLCDVDKVEVIECELTPKVKEGK